MKNNTFISYILSKSLFFGFIMSFIINNSSYLSFIAIFIGYLFGYITINYIINKRIKFNNLFIILLDTILLIYIIFNLSYQANNFFLNKTPTIFIIILFLLTIIYGACKNLDTTLNLSTILFPINIILIILGIIFNIENYNIIIINNINLLNFILSILITYIISILPIIIYINTDNNYNKNQILLGYILSCLTIIVINLNILFTISPTLLSYYQFPEYMTYKKIHMLTFIERIENIISFYSLIDFTILGIIIMLNIKNRFKKINQ